MNANGPPFPDWYLALDKGPTIVAVISTMTALATVFVAARVFVKSWVLRSPTADDWVLVVSLICGWISLAFSVVSVRYGNGRHMAALTKDQIGGAILYTLIGYTPSVLSISIPKYAVVMLLVKLLSPTTAHQVFLYVMVTLSGLALCGCMVIAFTQCTPTRAMWEIDLEKSCAEPWLLVRWGQFAGILSGVVDLYLALYPAVMMYPLLMNWKKKAALSSALGLGVVSGVIGFYKASTLWGLATTDFTWDTCDLTMWTCIEGSTIIIATCIPLLRPLLDLILGRRSFTSGNKSSERPYYKQGESNLEHGDKIQLSETPRQARPRRRGKSDIDTSILHTHIEAESQESILTDMASAPQQKSLMLESESEFSHLPKQHKNTQNMNSLRDTPQYDPSSDHTKNRAGITRTQEIRVEYGASEMADSGPNGKFHSSRWKAV